MINKILTKKPQKEVRDRRDLEAADALLKLSNGGGLRESDDHGSEEAILFGMDDKLKEAANKQLKIRIVMGKNSETNHKQSRSEEDIDSNEDRELSDDHQLIRSLHRKGEIRVEASKAVQYEYSRTEHSKNNRAKVSSVCGKDRFNPILSDATPIGEVESLLKPRKRQSSTSITPPKHPGFSFSIVHFLSAVRIALITPQSRESDLIYGKSSKGAYKKQKHTTDIHSETHKGSLQIHKNETAIIFADGFPQKILSSFTTDEIVHRVKLTPGDARVLELNMPLRYLVRGALMIFMSKTAPPGAKTWQALTSYDKISKTWSWVGPVSSILPLAYGFEEELSPKAWGVPCRTLSKMVDFYAQWLKAWEEVLQKIQSLPPPPPLTLMQCTSVNERFNDAKPRKNLVTISPSCEEVRAYFRREEALRYSIPEHSFSYTALDGKKSNVAPLRRCSGKPAARIRDHFILKQDRPPQFTVLCLVRDAAARLPDRLGTRLDICTLVRDSQFILDDISDIQISQVISGALDRLHYEIDPCVRFHKSWRLWLYLHSDREEEDFDLDCTSSRKVRKKNTAKLAGKSGIGEGSA